MYEAMKKVDEKEERFEALKKQSEIERKEREAKFRRENLIPEDELKPPGKKWLQSMGYFKGSKGAIYQLDLDVHSGNLFFALK